LQIRRTVNPIPCSRCVTFSTRCAACMEQTARAALEMAARLVRRCAHKRCSVPGDYRIDSGWTCERHLREEVRTKLLNGAVFCLIGLGVGAADVAGVLPIPGFALAILLVISTAFVGSGISGIWSGLKMRRSISG
jgi:hypothetical protein